MEFNLRPTGRRMKFWKGRHKARLSMLTARYAVRILGMCAEAVRRMRGNSAVSNARGKQIGGYRTGSLVLLNSIKYIIVEFFQLNQPLHPSIVAAGR